MKNLNIEYEIKVYDDGSTKPKPENKDISQFQNCQFIEQKRNIGRTAIRSLMAEEAQFQWILFLDADVLPTKTDFVKHYIDNLQKEDFDVISGGILYDDKKPSKDTILRWKYGREREAKPASERNKTPYLINSPNLCVKKSVFFKANNLHENYYGLDNYFSNQLKRLNTKVLHIDNPVVHHGLEPNSSFINKALKAVETTVILENRGLMDDDMRPIQKSYLKLKRWGLTNLFSFVISKFKRRMEANFQSENPNLTWFDLYRLNYYIQLKKKQYA